MRLITLRRGGASVDLDVCRSCHLVWFDAGELGQAVPATSEEAPVAAGSQGADDAAARVRKLPPEARAALGEFLATSVRSREERREEQQRRSPGGQEKAWMDALGVGVRALAGPGAAPGEDGDASAWVSPAAAALAALVVLGGLMGFASALGANVLAGEWSLDPLRPFRHFGLTWFTAPFLDTSWLQVTSAAYFLVMVGGLVEETAGTARFLGLAVLGALAGEAAQVVAAGAVGSVKAGGGLVTGCDGLVSLLLAFYSLSFPQARVGFPRRVGSLSLGWARYPAWGGLGAWLALVALGGWLEAGAFPVVALAGTTAGVVAGFACWRMAGRRDHGRVEHW